MGNTGWQDARFGSSYRKNSCAKRAKRANTTLYKPLEWGQGSAPAVYNAANEVALQHVCECSVGKASYPASLGTCIAILDDDERKKRNTR